MMDRGRESAEINLSRDIKEKSLNFLLHYRDGSDKGCSEFREVCRTRDQMDQIPGHARTLRRLLVRSNTRRISSATMGRVRKPEETVE